MHNQPRSFSVHHDCKYGTRPTIITNTALFWYVSGLLLWQLQHNVQEGINMETCGSRCNANVPLVIKRGGRQILSLQRGHPMPPVTRMFSHMPCRCTSTSGEEIAGHALVHHHRSHDGPCYNDAWRPLCDVNPFRVQFLVKLLDSPSVGGGNGHINRWGTFVLPQHAL